MKQAGNAAPSDLFERPMTPIREYEQAVYVYWLGPNLPTVKIGHTNDPDRRLTEFRRETGTPGHKADFAAIVWLDRRREAVERNAHRLLATARRDGEWFACTVEEALVTIIRAAESLNIRYEVEDRAAVLAVTQERIARENREAQRLAEWEALFNREWEQYLVSLNAQGFSSTKAEHCRKLVKQELESTFKPACIEQLEFAQNVRPAGITEWSLRKSEARAVEFDQRAEQEARAQAARDAEARRIAEARAQAEKVRREAAEQARRKQEALDAEKRMHFWRRAAAVGIAFFIFWAWNQDRIETERKHLHQFDNNRAACENAGGGWSKAYAGIGTSCYRKR